MKPALISISAATRAEREHVAELVALAAADLGVDVAAAHIEGKARKKAIEIGDIVSLVLSGAGSIGTGIVASAIYDKLKGSRPEAGRLTEHRSETEVEIVDNQLGTRIVIKTKTSETRPS